MTGSYTAKKGRPFYYIVLNYVDDTGKQKRPWIKTDIPVKGDNKNRVKARLKEVLAEYETQKIDLGKDVLFTVFLKEWLENLRPSIEAVTYDTYRLIVYNQIIPFFEAKKLKLRDVTSLHIQKYVKHKLETIPPRKQKAPSPNTIRKHLWNLSKCFDSAIKQNLIVFNPIKGIDMPKKVKYMGAKYYNEKQIDELLTAVKGDVLEGIIWIAVFYGLRRSEVLGLKWEAIDFINKTFDIKHTVVRVDKVLHKKDSTKNKSSYRSLPMTDTIIQMFKMLKAKQAQYKLLQPRDYIDEGYVFAKEDGSLINPNYVTKRFKGILTKNNLEIIRLHDLRHSTASYLLYLGFSMKEIQIWLGHGDIGTTMNLYTHVDMEAKRNMADSLNEKFSSFG